MHFKEQRSLQFIWENYYNKDDEALLYMLAREPKFVEALGKVDNLMGMLCPNLSDREIAILERLDGDSNYKIEWDHNPDGTLGCRVTMLNT